MSVSEGSGAISITHAEGATANQLDDQLRNALKDLSFVGNQYSERTLAELFCELYQTSGPVAVQTATEAAREELPFNSRGSLSRSFEMYKTVLQLVDSHGDISSGWQNYDRMHAALKLALEEPLTSDASVERATELFSEVVAIRPAVGVSMIARARKGQEDSLTTQWGARAREARDNGIEYGMIRSERNRSYAEAIAVARVVDSKVRLAYGLLCCASAAPETFPKAVQHLVDAILVSPLASEVRVLGFAYQSSALSEAYKTAKSAVRR
jgi:hypothetical protein